MSKKHTFHLESYKKCVHKDNLLSNMALKKYTIHFHIPMNIYAH